MENAQCEVVKDNIKWYTVKVMSNFEDKVIRLLNKGLEITPDAKEYFKEALMPSEVVSKVKDGKKSVRLRKLYPGYLFMKLKMYDDEGELNPDAYYFVTNVNGVMGFIGNKRPVALKTYEIDRILDHIKKYQGKEVPLHTYSMGQLVRILDGPFLNFEGQVQELDQEKGTLKVSVSIFGRDTPVELEMWQTEIVEKDD
jgi:transcription termination/antitermination protein NusG